MSVKTDNEHYARTERYAKEVQNLYFQIADHVARISSTQEFKDGIFTFKDYPVLNRNVDKLIDNMKKSMYTTIQSGISKEWKAANINNNKIINDAFSSIPTKLYSDVSKIPEELYQGIQNYAELTFRHVSSYLRDGIIINESKHQRTLDTISHLDKIFSNTKTVNGTFYRGLSMKDDEFTKFMELLGSGSYTEKSFSSMSKDLDVARSFADRYNKIILEVKGNGIDLEGKTLYNEKEVLANRNTTYKVEGIHQKDGITYVKLVEKFDDTAQSVISNKQYIKLFSNNSKALEAFQVRKINGLGLSERVWNYATQYKTEIEQALDVGIADGRSAAQLSRDIREYLREPEKLFRRVRDKNGILKPSKNALKYNPGGGVYRSSYKNAMRLARTEINQSYREADYLRWQQMDFVVGIEIRRSNHEYGCPVCESLKGKYPKDFKFIGWHPHCRCHAIPILATQKELLNSIENDTPIQLRNEVKDMPNNFTKWMKENEDRAVRAKTLPFFIQNNLQFVDSNTIKERSILELMEKAKSAETSVSSLSNSIAEKFGGYSTPVNFKSYDSIKRKANSDYNGNVNKIQDSIRTTIILPEKNIEKCLEYIQKNTNFIRIKIQTPDKFMGYSGTITNAKTNVDVIGEIQVNTAKMIYAKEEPKTAKVILGVNEWNRIKKETGMPGGLGHKYYEEFRKLNKNIPEQAKRMIELDKLSNEYYKHFR